jgi:hypothetical protein
VRQRRAPARRTLIGQSRTWPLPRMRQRITSIKRHTKMDTIIVAKLIEGKDFNSFITLTFYPPKGRGTSEVSRDVYIISKLFSYENYLQTWQVVNPLGCLCYPFGDKAWVVSVCVFILSMLSWSFLKFDWCFISLFNSCYLPTQVMLIHTYIPSLTLYPRRGSRGISDISPRRPRFTKITTHEEYCRRDK